VNIAGKSALVDSAGTFKKPATIDDGGNTTREEGEGHDMKKDDADSEY
jgi:hypothetical protein